MDREAEEALCDLQAQVYVLRLALRAMVRTHSDPDAALVAWRQALAEAAKINPAAPAEVRNSDYLAERCEAFIEDWTAELVDRALPTQP